MRKIIPWLVLSFVFTTQSLHAQVRLARVFNDHMVLQRQKPVRIWGTADAGNQVIGGLRGPGGFEGQTSS